MTVGSIDSTDRPQDRADVALFFAATSPTQAFNQAAEQVAQEQGSSLSENARVLVLIKHGDERQLGGVLPQQISLQLLAP